MKRVNAINRSDPKPLAISHQPSIQPSNQPSLSHQPSAIETAISHQPSAISHLS
jgi:hypothetical protein